MLAQYTVDFNGIIMTRVDDVRLIGAVIMVAILGKDLVTEIQIILRLFLVIAMYCQARSSQFNESINLPRF